MNGLIIEGVAGTGKSTLLSLLKNSPSLKALRPNFIIIDEDQTIGELVSELRDDSTDDRQKCYRLEHLLPRIKDAQSKSQFVILERFHPTYFALMPHWDLIEEYDNLLSEMGFGLVLLDLPNNLLVNRSYFRPEMEDQNWQQGLTEWYGSQDKAVQAFIESQENRRLFWKKTKLPVLQIDTREKTWQNYHDKVLVFITQ